jgi:thioredoxin 1
MIKVLKFYADWCGPCKMLSKTLEDVQTNVMIEEIDIDENMNLAKEYGIRGVPTMVMLDDNVEVKRITGATTKEKLEEWLNQ